jgi:hypothetical protein
MLKIVSKTKQTVAGERRWVAAGRRLEEADYCLAAIGAMMSRPGV